MCVMGRNCCCINGLWLKGQSHPHSHTGKVAIDNNINHSLILQSSSAKKKHHLSSPSNRCLQVATNGHTNGHTKRFCDHYYSRKTYSQFCSSAKTRIEDQSKQNNWRKECLMYLIIFTVSLLCFVNSLNGEFVHDDIVAVTTNPDVLGKTHLYQLFLHDFWGKAMSDPDSHKSYRPLTTLTFRLNMLYSTRTFGFHLINTLLHTIVVLLMAYLTRNELKFNIEITLLSSLLFATHPIHCEAVSSIVGRADVLCCIFYLVSFIAFAKSLRCPSVNKSMIFSLLICQISSILALLSKEQGITVLGACIVYFLISRRKCLKMPFNNSNETHTEDSVGQCKVWLYSPLLTVVITLILSLSFRILLLGGTLPYFTEQDNPASFSKSVKTRFLTYSYLSSFNARLLLSPIILSYDWQMGSIQLITRISDARNTWALILVFTLAAILWKICRQSTSSRVEELMNRNLCVGIALLILPYIPASNLFVTVGFVVAERVLYIPSIGMIILVCTGLQRLTQSKSLFAIKFTPIIRSALFALIVIFAIKTVRQNRSWLSREALFESGLKSVPQNAKTHYNYANLQKDLGNIKLAMRHYRSALSLWPDHASAHNNLGTIFCELSETDEAERHFKAALAINPFHPRAHFNLANIYSKQGLTSKAISLLKKAIELDEQFAEPYSALASLYAENGRNEDAEKLHLQALQLDGDNADFCNNYGAFLQKIGRTDLAVKQYLKAIEIQPNHTVALVNAARTLRSMRHTNKAETLYKRALAVQEDPQILDNLGVLYISSAKLAEATKIYEKLSRLYPEHRDGIVHYAQLLIQERNFSRAEQMLYSVINTNSSHRDAYHQLAILYSQLNKTSQALDSIVKALQLCSPDDKTCAQMYVEHGDILRDLRDWQSAAESYKIAISLDSGLSRSHLNLAVICHLDGDYFQALHHYQTAHTLDPDNPLILDNMAKLKRRLFRQKYYSNRCHRDSQLCHVVR